MKLIIKHCPKRHPPKFMVWRPCLKFTLNQKFSQLNTSSVNTFGFCGLRIRFKEFHIRLPFDYFSVDLKSILRPRTRYDELVLETLTPKDFYTTFVREIPWTKEWFQTPGNCFRNRMDNLFPLSTSFLIILKRKVKESTWILRLLSHVGTVFG